MLAACALCAAACLLLALWPRLQPGPGFRALVPVQTGAAALEAPADLPINRASLEDLKALPGISAVVAQAILDRRAAMPFRYPEDLLSVPGVGEARLEALMPLLTPDR